MRVILGKGNDMEELIKRLERVIATGAPDKDGMHPISAEAVLEVVKGLSEHSTNLAEVGTDCFSRQAAIDLLKQMRKDGDMIPWEGKDVFARIRKLPPAQPEPLQPWEVLAAQAVLPQPKRGKWIRTGSGSLYDHYECSECGKAPKWECMGDNRWKIAFTDFCPNCGAKMEVNNESN